MVAHNFNIKTLVVPWHLVHTLLIPYGCLVIQPGHDSILHHLRTVYQQCAPSFLETGKSPTMLGPDCTEDAQPWPQLSLHIPRENVRHTTAWGNFPTSHWTPETNDRLHQNRCADCMRKHSLLSGWPGNNFTIVAHGLRSNPEPVQRYEWMW